MLADVHVVTDLDQVVELDPVLDHRVVQRSAVYAGIGADFHIVADPHATELLDLHPCSVLGSKPEAVRSQHHAGMQQTARPHMAVLANSDARLQHGVGTDGGTLFNHAERADRGRGRSEEHTSELQSPCNLVCRLLLEKKTN